MLAPTLRVCAVPVFVLPISECALRQSLHLILRTNYFNPVMYPWPMSMQTWNRRPLPPIGAVEALGRIALSAAILASCHALLCGQDLGL